MIGLRPARHHYPPAIEHQIIRLGVWLILMALAAYAVIMTMGELGRQHTVLERRLQVLAAVLGQQSVPALQRQDAHEAHAILSSLRLNPDIASAAVLDATGRELGTYRRHASMDCWAAPDGSEGVTYRWCGISLHSPIHANGAKAGTIAVVMDLRSTWRALSVFLGLNLVSAALLMLLTIPLLRRTAKRLSLPFVTLVEVAERIGSEQDFSLRVNAGGSREAVALSQGFNRMLAQLDAHNRRLLSELQQRVQAEKRLQEMAYIDPLTGLNNRRAFHEALDERLAQGTTDQAHCAVIYIDIDGFKAVNDTLGHSAGDQVLREVARRLRDNLRQSDVVTRLGGDEFAVLAYPLAGAESALRIAEKVRVALAFAYEAGDQLLPQVSASVGVAIFPDTANEHDALIRQADAAMYRAKLAGKNQVRMFSTPGEAAESRHEVIAADLAWAVGHEQLFLEYQPQVRLESPSLFDDGTGALVGFEALVRWRHPALGLVRPDEFIPVAESNGTIIQIGEWVLRTACSQLQRWRSAGLPHLKMSVNFSGRQLMDGLAVERLIDILSRSSLPADSIDLELTESLLVEHTPEVLKRLEALRAAGFGLAIDDFGTGFSSLACIDDFPLSVLKIDRRFVQRIGQADHSDAVTRCIVAISQALDLQVIAEGIEFQHQQQALQLLGCNIGQGYLYAAPMGAKETDGWLKERFGVQLPCT